MCVVNYVDTNIYNQLNSSEHQDAQVFIYLTRYYAWYNRIKDQEIYEYHTLPVVKQTNSMTNIAAGEGQLYIRGHMEYATFAKGQVLKNVRTFV